MAQLGWIQIPAGAGMLPGSLLPAQEERSKGKAEVPGGIKARWHKQQHRLCPALPALPVPSSTARLHRARCPLWSPSPCSHQDSKCSCEPWAGPMSPPGTLGTAHAVLEENCAWHSRQRWHPTCRGWVTVWQLSSLPVPRHWLRWDTGRRRFSAPLRVLPRCQAEGFHQGLLGKASMLCLG